MEPQEVVSPNNPELIVPPYTLVESACIDLDVGIDKCLASIQQMLTSVEYLKIHLEHPLQVEALNNIEGLINEAMMPYLGDIHNEFKYIADT